MRLTTRTNLAIRVLMYCGVNEDRISRSAEIAEACNASANHLAQVVHLLHVNDFITATRGRTGGVRLARAASMINIGQVFRVFEAEMPFTECAAPDTNTCPLVSSCRLKSAIQRALDAFFHELDMVTLEDLVKGNCGLTEILRIREGLQPQNCAETVGA